MSDSANQYQGMSALVVDDDPAVRLVIRKKLERQGFVVVTANDGEGALDACTTTRFDLVITDLSMPGMSGLDFMRLARDAGLDAPVIFLTATASVPSAVEAMKSGAFEFLEKPLRADRLVEIVDAAMTSRKARVSPVPKVKGGAVDRDDWSWPPSSGTRKGNDEVTRPTKPAGRDKSSLLLDIEVGPVKHSATPPPLPRVRKPRLIGRYEVVERIGRGGMGTVYRCQDPLLGRSVAVKVLELVAEERSHLVEMVQRFQREAAAAAALSHPGIVSVHDMGHDDDLDAWFIVMELIDGEGLNAMLTREGRLPVRRSVLVGFELADALAYAHERGVTHRDIKPSNVLVEKDGKARLLDFGLASVEGWSVTRTGRVFGSPSYMAPERIRGKAGGPASDQFSLGAVLWETVAGESPFEAETVEARLIRVMEHVPAPLTDLDRAVPGGFGATVARMMAKDVSDRFASMADVAVALAAVASEMGIDPTQDIHR